MAKARRKTTKRRGRYKGGTAVACSEAINQRTGRPKKGYRRGKGGKCYRAKRSYNKCRRRTVTYEGVPVVLPCGSTSLTPTLRGRVDRAYPTYTQWNSCRRANQRKDGACRVVFFTAQRPIMRRPVGSGGKKLSRIPRRRRRSGARKGQFY